MTSTEASRHDERLHPTAVAEAVMTPLGFDGGKTMADGALQGPGRGKVVLTALAGRRSRSSGPGRWTLE
jgi:hypothetical protein